MQIQKTKSQKVRVTALVLAVLLVLTTMLVIRKSVAGKVYPAVDITPLLAAAAGENTAYDSYLLSHAGKELPVETTAAVDPHPGLLRVGEAGSFSVDIPHDGLYRLAFTLAAPAAGTEADPSDRDFRMEVDGALPFAESSALYVARQWVNAAGGFETDGAGNELLPILTEREDSYVSCAMSRSVYTAEPVCWYLTAGTHTMTLTALTRDIPYQQLMLTGSVSDYTATGIGASGAQTITLQAEAPDARTSPSILEQTDQTSAATMRASIHTQVLNTLGGTSWERVGDSVSWRFTVKTAGHYRLVFRCRQDFAGGIATYRLVTLDGQELPGNGLLRIPYAAGWQRVELAVGGENRGIWLEPGEHTLTLTASLGDMEPVLSIMNACMEQCNTIYRRIIMITSTSPDPYRDYRLNEKIPDEIRKMAEQAVVLRQVSAYLAYLNQGGGSEIAPLDKLAHQLEELSNSHRKIASQISTLNANISALGTWIQDRSNQPLELDWIQLIPEGGQEQPAEASWVAGFLHGFRRLLSSYVDDYNQLGGGTEEGSAVDVWLVSGRDQAQIIQRLCNYTFTPQSGIPVRLKLVQNGAIMSATMAGIGPDVSLMNLQADPINYAIRHAVMDLSEMPGIDEVVQDFYPSAMVPLTYRGGIYGLPETQSFPVLFYRRDILDELGLSVPDTWEDVYNMMADLQKNNMQFGLPTGASAYTMFLYQNQGKLYENEGESSCLNSAESAEAFRVWTQFYKDYQMPLTYDFLNRFRTGEVPMAIQDYSAYSSLVIFAPEIRDKWEIAPIPGTRSADGTIHRDVGSTGTSAMMFHDCSDPSAAWTFLRWWVGEEAQSAYAREMETRLGPQARVSVANRQAFERQLWTADQSRQIRAQWESVVGTPEVPGGYFLSRHVDNAFRKIVYQGSDRRETLTEYARIINKELTSKRAEFGVK